MHGVNTTQLNLTNLGAEEEAVGHALELVHVVNLQEQELAVRIPGTAGEWKPVVQGSGDLMGGGDPAEVGHVLDGPHGEAAVDEAVVHEHVGHPEERDPQALRCTSANWLRDRVKILPSFFFFFI